MVRIRFPPAPSQERTGERADPRRWFHLASKLHRRDQTLVRRRALFHKLTNGEWIDAHDNLILCGPTDPAS
jgi:hypothetical protein